MKKSAAVLILAALTVLCLFSARSFADETKMIGVITKIELAADGASATVTLKDNKSNEDVLVLVNDELTLDKFKDHRIVAGDEIRLKYEVQDGKNVSRYFRKTAGC
jgi:hypothetical protein